MSAALPGPTYASSLHEGPILEGEAVGTPLGARLADALADLARRDLAEWATRLPDVTLADVALHLRFSTERYQRIPLVVAEDAEAILIAWLPGQRSGIHDHGGSKGVAMVLGGSGAEESFRLEGERVLPAGERAFGAGDTLFEAPGDVHRVRAAGPGLLVTLHLYAPRLTEYRTYEVRR